MNQGDWSLFLLESHRVALYYIIRWKREEGRGKKEGGRGKREEGRRKREEGRGKKKKYV